MGSKADLGILVKLVGGNVVDGEDELDIVLLCLFNEVLDLLGSLRVKERSTDLPSAKLLSSEFAAHLDIVQGLLEGERHTTTNDQSVDLSSAYAHDLRHSVYLVEHVLNKLDLVGNLGSTENSEERSFGVLENFGKVFKFLLHQETGSSLGELDANHGRMGSVGGTEAADQRERSESQRKGPTHR